MSPKTLLLLCSFFLAFTAIFGSVSAKEFPVGGVVGWRIPAKNESQLYNVWASRRRFHVGDTLRFRYKNDSVAVVEKYGFYHCDSSNPIAFFDDGDTVVSLDNAGTMYFISGNADRCKEGVIMTLEVKSASPVRYFPPTISNPPENSYSVGAPGPAQYVSSGGSPFSSPGPSSSDSVAVVSVSVFVIVAIVGLALLVIS